MSQEQGATGTQGDQPARRPTTSRRCRRSGSRSGRTLQPFRADDDVVRSGTREKRYALTMFPYPSGDLHMGHAEVFALHDVIARYWWQRGYEVLNPMGFDSFGLNAENAAIQRQRAPGDLHLRQHRAPRPSRARASGSSFDWTRTFNTSDPEYYRWTQWLFLKFRERGLAYRKKSPVNWCPHDQTVLANEQVIDGHCERCGAEVTKRELTQWYFKITDYAQELLDCLDDLAPTWPERVITAQRNWIGRSEGAHVTFPRRGPGTADPGPPPRSTRPGPTRCSARRSWWWRPTRRWPASWSPTSSGRRTTRTWQEVRKASDIDRLATDRPKTGVFLGVDATNPVNGDRGSRCTPPTTCWPTTAPARSWRCPAQDQRDWDFAKVFDLPIIRTVQPPEDWEGDAFTGDGPAVNSRNDSSRPGRHGHRRGQARDHRLAGGAGRRSGRGELPAARLAAVAPALLGRADPDHPLRRPTARSRSPRTSCPSSCPSCAAPT